MSALAQKILTLKKAANMHRNVPYLHFGTTTYEHALGATTAPMWLERIISELQYALQLSIVNADAYDAPINAAADALLADYDRHGALTKAAAEDAEQLLLPIKYAAKAYTVHMVSHAHIDMNWQWPMQETVAITLETFRTVLSLMDQYPDFTFSQSQASCYRIVEEYEPKMLPLIRARIKEGRWEVAASTWVEGDKNMPSAESFARHLLYTKNYLSKLLEIDPATLNLDYEPDTFGHAATIPGILADGGVKYYYHCRGYEGHNIYNWRAPSGDSVLVYREPTWYLGDTNPTFALLVPSFCADHGITEYLKIYGVGDHGGGPTRRDISYINEMMTWPIFPTLKFSTYAAFYAHLETHRESFPIVDNELNCVFTGCYTTQCRVKAANRLGEASLSEAEALSAAAHALAGRDYDAAAFETGWRNILFSQFHDILTGSGVRDTREYALAAFQQVMGITGTAYVGAMRDIANSIDTSSIIENGTADFDCSEGAGTGFGVMRYHPPISDRGATLTRVYHLFNPAPQERTEVVQIALWDWLGDMNRIRVTNGHGASVACQIIKSGRDPFFGASNYMGHIFKEMLVEATVPGLGWTTIVLDQHPDFAFPRLLPSDPRVETPDDFTLENEYLCAKFCISSGALISLTDKTSGAQLIKPGTLGGFYYIEEDTNKGMTSWVVGRYMSRTPLTANVRVKRVFAGELRSALEMTIPFGKSSTVYATVSLDKGSRSLSYDVKCDFHEIGTPNTVIPQLAFAAPLNFAANKAIYDIPAGIIERAPLNLDVPANSFVAAAHENGALTLTTDTKYGYRFYDNTLQVTLIRAAFDPDPYPERGEHFIKISLIANPDTCPMTLSRAAHDANRPINHMTARPHAGNLPMTGSFLTLDRGPIALQGVKMAEDGDGIIVRLYDIVGDGGEARLTFINDVKTAVAVNVLEHDAAGKVARKGKTVTATVPKKGMVSVKVALS